MLPNVLAIEINNGFDWVKYTPFEKIDQTTASFISLGRFKLKAKDYTQVLGCFIGAAKHCS